MTKFIAAASLALALIGSASTAAMASPHHPMMNHHRHSKMVCSMSHHHKHCRKVWY